MDFLWLMFTGCWKRKWLFSIDIVKEIDDKENGYDDINEQRELEKRAVSGYFTGIRSPHG